MPLFYWKLGLHQGILWGEAWYTRYFGAIDGTQIPLLMPPGNRWKCYVNQKGWASTTFQFIVNGDGNFRDVGDVFQSYACLQWLIRAGFHLFQICGGWVYAWQLFFFQKSEIEHSLIPYSQDPKIIPTGTYLIGDASWFLTHLLQHPRMKSSTSSILQHKWLLNGCLDTLKTVSSFCWQLREPILSEWGTTHLLQWYYTTSSIDKAHSTSQSGMHVIPRKPFITRFWGLI